MREYPFTAWILGGTFIPRQVTLVRSAGYNGVHKADNGKYHYDSSIFETKDQAIMDGYERLKQQEAKIAKQQEGIAKRRANLEKHS